MASSSNNKRILLFGRTGSGKSTLANMLVSRDLTPPLEFEVSDGIRSCTMDVTEKSGTEWTVVDTVGMGEKESDSIPKKDPRAILMDFMKAVGKDRYTHIAYVKKAARSDSVDELIWKSFVRTFKGAEDSFVVIFTAAKEGWLKKEMAHAKKDFPECKEDRFLSVDFLPDDEDEYISKYNRTKREESLKSLERELERIFRERSCVRVKPDFSDLQGEALETEAVSIMQYVADVVKKLLDKNQWKVALRASVQVIAIFAAVAQIVSTFG